MNPNTIPFSVAVIIIAISCLMFFGRADFHSDLDDPVVIKETAVKPSPKPNYSSSSADTEKLLALLPKNQEMIYFEDNANEQQDMPFEEESVQNTVKKKLIENPTLVFQGPLVFDDHADQWNNLMVSALDQFLAAQGIESLDKDTSQRIITGVAELMNEAVLVSMTAANNGEPMPEDFAEMPQFDKLDQLFQLELGITASDFLETLNPNNSELSTPNFNQAQGLNLDPLDDSSNFSNESASDDSSYSQYNEYDQ